MSTHLESDIKLEDFIPAQDLPNKYPHIFRTHHQVTWLIRNRDTNGLTESRALVRFRKEWVFVKPKLAKYLASRTAEAA